MNKQFEIIAIYSRRGKTLQWLSDKTGINYHDINYELKRAKPENLKEATYRKCIDVFIEEGWVKNPATALKDLERTVQLIQKELAEIQMNIATHALDVGGDGIYDLGEQESTKVFAINWKHRFDKCIEGIIQ